MAFLAETVKTGTKNHYVIEAMHVLQRELKKNLEIFQNVSVQILPLERVHYFGRSEHNSVVGKKIRITIGKTAMVRCCKFFLYANGFCDEHAGYFWRRLK